MPESRAPIRVQLSARSAPALPDCLGRLLLRAAVLDPARARSAWGEWRAAGGSIETVDMPTFRLLPLVYRSLEQARVDDPDLTRLKGIYRYAWAANQQLAHRVAPALEALRQDDIPTMLLKGAAVTATHYHDGGARPMDDVDVLVPPGDAERALAVLRDAGWSLIAPIEPRRILRSVHSTPLAGRDGAQVDLHWRVLPESTCDEDFWAAAVPAGLGGSGTLGLGGSGTLALGGSGTLDLGGSGTLAPGGSGTLAVGGSGTLAPGAADQLLHTCAHGLRHGPASLRWIADAAVIIRDAGASLDWARLVDGAATRRLPLRMITALGVLRDLLDLAVPDDVMAELAALPVGPNERVVLRLAQKPFLLGSYVQQWDCYRRLNGADEARVSSDFLQYIADVRHLPSRRSIGTMLARRTISLASASFRARRAVG